MIPTTNKPTRTGKYLGTATDHIISNCIIGKQFKAAILETVVADPFPITMTLKIDEPIHQCRKVQNVQKLNYDEKTIKSFKQRLREIDWVEFKKCEDPNEAFNHLFETLISVYEFQFYAFFSKMKVRIKP